MSPLEPTPQRRSVKSQKTGPFWVSRWLEFSIVLLVILGIFLLVEQTDVSENILLGFRQFVFALGRVIVYLGAAVSLWVGQTEVSDLLGYSLIVLAIILLGYRTRLGLLNRFPNTRLCPRCQSELLRQHTSTWRRIWGAAVRVRVKQYGCTNQSCKWLGYQVAGR